MVSKLKCLAYQDSFDVFVIAQDAERLLHLVLLDVATDVQEIRRLSAVQFNQILQWKR